MKDQIVVVVVFFFFPAYLFYDLQCTRTCTMDHVQRNHRTKVSKWSTVNDVIQSSRCMDGLGH